MTAEQRRTLIGDAAIADAQGQADRAIAGHPPTPELLADLALTLAPAAERVAQRETEHLAAPDAA